MDLDGLALLGHPGRAGDPVPRGDRDAPGPAGWMACAMKALFSRTPGLNRRCIHYCPGCGTASRTG